ncbi:MAG TPA: histidine--tRNA ligase [Hyphomicrobiales bacterium]|nr:histidine--tRNA ligase [Hyphomicrobiales bacterium]
MADDKKSDRLKARLPRGFADRGPGEIAATRAMLDAIRQVYELWGFEALETPFLEYTDALGKFLPDQDRPNAGVFSLQDDDDQWVSLRYDLTAPLARYVAENWDRVPKPFRSYRVGPVFRNEKPGPGRFRQFVQFDADIVGAPSVAADAEMCMMLADTLEALGIPRGQYVIKVNNRKVLDGVLEAIGLGGDDKARQRLTVLRAIDKLDRLGIEGVRALLGPGRKDESGDFTKGAGLDEGQIQLVLTSSVAPQVPNDAGGVATTGTPVSAAVDPVDVVEATSIGRALETLGTNELFSSGQRELAQIKSLCDASGYGIDRVRIDPSVVRGLEYYTGPVYEAELLFEVKNEDGQPVRFGSVAGGGRYDGLVARFRGEPAPATGFSIGVSRLQAALAALGREKAAPAGPVVVLVMDRERVGDYFAMAAKLRNALKDDPNFPGAEVYLGGSGMKAQMKYADRRRAPLAIIQGSDEKARGEVTIKDLALGAEMSAGIAERAEWIAARPAQVTVPEAALVETVRKMLAP